MNEEKYIVIGGAWPYANSLLHLGHVAGLISGDILARYFRSKGYHVAFVSGSDCHGTPITQRAKKEGKTPKEIAEYYDGKAREMLEAMEFSYDLYTNTDTDFHKQECMKIFQQIYENGYIYEKLEPQAYCEKCGKFLSDRDVQIICPACGTETKADQCDGCGRVPNVEDLKGGTCLICGTKTVERDNKNLYFALSKFQKEIEEHTKEVNHDWRINAKNETAKYLKEGLLDRAVTRDLDWGVDIPLPNYEDKKMYVWIEAVLGYITATKKWCEGNGLNWEDFWKKSDHNKVYMVHGKDNIVFHSIILNGLLLAMKDNYRLVDTIVSSEYLNVNDEKISKSKGNGTPALELAKEYNADSLRFHLINNGPEKKDSNFTIDNYITTHNNEILNKFGNLVNRTLKFKGLETLPQGKMNAEMEQKTKEAYEKVGQAIEKIEFKEATDLVMDLVEAANKFYDTEEPWKQKKEDEEGFANTIYTCTNMIANLANLFEPFMPASSKKLREYLHLPENKWEYVTVTDLEAIELTKIEPLFTRI